MPQRQIRYSLDTGPGSQTILAPLAALDLSCARSLVARLELTKAANDNIDTLDITLQATYDGGVTWDDRLRFPQYLGNATVSATAPETYELTIHQFNALSAGEAKVEPSGSAGASAISANTVVNGPFPGVQRDSTGRLAGWRWKIAVVDADNDADFEGMLRLIYDA